MHRDEGSAGSGMTRRDRIMFLLAIAFIVLMLVLFSRW